MKHTSKSLFHTSDTRKAWQKLRERGKKAVEHCQVEKATHYEYAKGYNWFNKWPYKLSVTRFAYTLNNKTRVDVEVIPGWSFSSINSFTTFWFIKRVVLIFSKVDDLEFESQFGYIFFLMYSLSIMNYKCSYHLQRQYKKGHHSAKDNI